MSPDTGYRHFHDQLDALKQRLIDMSEHAERLVEVSVEALLEHDADKAHAVIVGDRTVDAALLALGAPHDLLVRDLLERAEQQATGGLMTITGEPGSPPTKSGLSLVDLSGGYVAAIAMLAGAHGEPQPFRPVIRGRLLTGAKPIYMSARPIGAESFVSHPSTRTWKNSTIPMAIQ